MNPAAYAISIFLLISSASGQELERFEAFSLKNDLDGDGQIESIRLDKWSDPALTVMHGKRLMWSGVPARWKPWKLMVADVDGDGTREIAVGVFKATRYFPKAHNCLFIYSWDGTRAHPKWLGSSLSRPFVDFAFLDARAGGRQQLVSIEIKRDGRRCVAAYSWNGFGFTLDWQRGDWREAKLLSTAKDEIVLEADGQRLTLRSDEMRNGL